VKSRKGRLTRAAILEEAVHLASVHGLEGLSIGQLAEATGMSKAGLFAHFGSKEELQLATVEAARERFIAAVIEPVKDQAKGLPRLRGLLESWLAYGPSGTFRGGCFFAAASTEFDGRPGPVRDRVRETMKQWTGLLKHAVREAVEEGHLQPEADPTLLGFEFLALAMAANNAFQLHEDPRAFDLARRAFAARLDALEVRP
jgi:AcrR family transcriptional regulator